MSYHHAIIFFMAKKKKDYSNAICCECGSGVTYIYHGSPKWYGCKCGRKGCTDILCNKCYSKKRNDLPDSYKNLKIELRSSEKLSIATESGLGILGECVIANILKIRNCKNCVLSKKEYSWSSLYDLEKDGVQKIQVKLGLLGMGNIASI